MSFNDTDDEPDYPVGYGKPPKHTQFKKGKSGNPKGRPPQKILHQAVIDTLNEEVTIIINGEKVTMTKKEAAIQQLVTQSIKGKSSATRNLILLLRCLPQLPPV